MIGEEHKMNNQLENLMYKAGLTAQGCWDEMDDYDKEAIKRFAELIIEECALVANEHVEECEGTNYGVGHVLKRHFGINDVDAQLRNRSTYFGNNP
jgi:hypothetical protein